MRVPSYGKPNSARVEVRSIDSACNPYLAFAVLLAAGLKGIEEGYELPPGAEDDVWSLSTAERRAMGYESLPENLAEAIDVMARSELVAEVLGEHVFDLLPAQQAHGVGGVPPGRHPVRAPALPVRSLHSDPSFGPDCPASISATKVTGTGSCWLNSSW